MRERETRALREVPSPEFWIRIAGFFPANQAPAASPTATSSRTAAR